MNYSNYNNKKIPNKYGDYIVNEYVRYPQVLVIGPTGDPLGVKTSKEAMQTAKDFGLDLLCVAPNATPPVCKIVNFGKFRYEQDKKQKAIKSNQVRTELKEIRMSPVIDKHDIETKARHAISFLNDKDKVKVVVRFRGRQLSHPEVGQEIMNRFIEMCKDVGSVEKAPNLDGKLLTAILAPKK